MTLPYAVCHLRIAQSPRRGYLYAVTRQPSHAPLTNSNGDALPTVAVKLRLELPDGAFNPAMAVLEAKIPESDIEIAMEVGA